jgi:hypothetical protein
MVGLADLAVVCMNHFPMAGRYDLTPPGMFLSYVANLPRKSLWDLYRSCRSFRRGWTLPFQKVRKVCCGGSADAGT